MSSDFSTTYLGLRLTNPFMADASPLADHLDTARRLEDAGSAAIVLHSLFEEQISEAESGRIHHLDPLNRQFATILSYSLSRMRTRSDPRNISSTFDA